MGKPLVRISDWGICVMGRVASGPKILTSRIVSAHSCVVVTDSGSKYKLFGPPCASYMGWMLEHRITYDPKRPVKVRKDGSHDC